MRRVDDDYERVVEDRRAHEFVPNFLLLILVLIRENQIDLLISEQIDERFRERLIVRARDAYAALVVRGQNRRDYPQNARILKKPADSEHGNRCRFVDAAAGIVPSLAYGKRFLQEGVPGLGELDAMSIARYQFGSELFFNRDEMLAQSRLGNAAASAASVKLRHWASSMYSLKYSMCIFIPIWNIDNSKKLRHQRK